MFATVWSFLITFSFQRTFARKREPLSLAAWCGFQTSRPNPALLLRLRGGTRTL